MTLPDLTAYSDEDLDDLRVAVVNEIERRANLATIPATIQQLASKFIEGGGDPAELSIEPTGA